jgi:hypothetical protein
MACVCLRASARTHTMAEWATCGSQNATYDARRNVHRSSGLHSTGNSQRTAASVQHTAYTIQRTPYSSADHAHTHRDSRTAAAHCARLQSCCTSRRSQRAQPRVMCALRLPVNQRCACVRTRADSVRVCARPCIRACLCAHGACVRPLGAKARACAGSRGHHGVAGVRSAAFRPPAQCTAHYCPQGALTSSLNVAVGRQAQAHNHERTNR